MRQATDYPYWKISNTYNPYAVHDPNVWGWERIASFRGYSVWHKSPLAGIYVPKPHEGVPEAEIAALPDLEDGRAILEIMPYGGTYTAMMLRRYGPNVHIHYAELSELHRRFIEEKLRQEGLSINNLHPAVMEKGHLPHPDDQFDLVFLPQVLEAVPEPEVLLDETRRVLKSGGQAVVSARNSISWFGWLFRRKLRHQPVTNFGPARPRPSFAIRRLLMQRFKMAEEFGLWPSPTRRSDRLNGGRRFFGRLYVARVVKV
jgi:SAM-dependent methyltransferase